MDRIPQPRTSVRWLLFGLAFVITSGFRFLTLGDGFPNDHFVYITGGWQMLFGEWPTRDWVDPGLPLMFAASALAQAIFGKVLFAEAVLVSGAFGLGAALTAAAVLELTGSLWIAILAAVLEVAVFPRTYGYPKVLVYAAAFLCFARYINRPSTGRVIAMAVSVVVAFLFRHDHGLFLGVGGALTIALAPSSGGLRTRVRSLGLFVGVGLLLVLPYLVYVEANGGLLSYVRTGMDFSRREAARQWHVWPAVVGDVDPLASALVYELYAVPLLALAVLVVCRRDPRIGIFTAQVIPVAAVALMVNYYFIRDPLVTRLPDAIVPALMLGAWLILRTASTQRLRPVAIPVAALSVVLFSASVGAAGDIVGNLERADLIHEWDHIPRLLRERTQSLHERFSERQIPTRATAGLLPFFSYVDRCTTPDQRLLVGGYLVELPFFAQRRFAAGQPYFGGSFGGEELQRQALRRLREQVVPFAVIPSDYVGNIESNFHDVGQYLQSRYTTLTNLHITNELDLKILVDTSLTPTGRDPETGWPCFRAY